MKKIFFVDKNFEGSRLDRWIRKNISDLPQSLIEKNINYHWPNCDWENGVGR